ncbi:hypothetical protein, partial [Geitlerinema sp. P-1104]|uniref:hypothetical protein n=1 Tax=Geitlerinema sp. P-1104 TaxID=2546230 RepID=UPI0014770901
STETSEFLIEQLNATPAEGGGEVQAAVRVELPEQDDEAPVVEAEFIVRNASADAIARRYDVPTTGTIGPVSARGILQTAGDETLIGLPIIEIAGGRAQGAVLLQEETWRLELATESVSLASVIPQDIGQTYGVGGFTGQLVLAGEIGVTELEQLEALAQGNLQLLGAAVPLEAALQNGTWETILTAENLTPPSNLLPQELAQLPLGAISGNLQVAGTVADLEDFNLANLSGRTSFTTTIAESPLRLDGSLGDGLWQAQLVTEGLPLAPFIEVPPELTLGTFAGRAGFGGDVALLETLSPQTLEAEIQGELTVNQGRVEIASRITQGQLQGEAIAQNVNITPFVPTAELTASRFSGRGEFRLPLDNLSPETLEAVIQGELTVNQGRVEIASRITQGQLQGEASAQNVNITPFVPTAELTPSRLSGQGQFRVPLDNPSPETLMAEGQMQVILGEGGLGGRFELAQGTWLIDAEQLQIPLTPFVDAPVALSPLVKVGEIARLTGSVTDLRPQAISGQLQVGFIVGTTTLVQDPTQDLGQVLMDITLEDGGWQVLAQLQNAQLEELVPGLPQLPTQTAALDVAGRLDGAIALTGGWQEFTPINLAIQEGAMRVRDFQVGDRPYDSVIEGPITATKEGVLVQLAGQTETILGRPRDGLFLRLTPDLSPQAFALQLGETTAEGLLENKLWNLDLRNFPLAMLNLQPMEDRGILAGDLTAQVRAAPTGSLVSGTLDIRDPRLGLTQADSLQGQFVWAEEVLQLDSVELQQGESRYSFDGTVTTQANPQFAGAFKIYRGEIQQILEALRWFDLDDVRRGLEPATYAGVEALTVLGVGNPEDTLIRQVQRLVEIDLLLQQQQTAREDASPLPDLAKLQGQFSGDVNVSGSLKQGVDFDFNLVGQNWQWDRYQIHDIASQGLFEQGVWDIQQLNIAANLDDPQVTRL